VGKETHSTSRGLEERVRRVMWHVGVPGEFTQGFGGGPEKRDHLENLPVEEMIILKLIFKSWDGEVCTRFIWLRTGTGGGGGRLL
jgi:hypothetical protein